ncbi:MAG: putative quinol monooxygenase [Bacteroidales bacterium]|nr:putative quinol monooxygenase [Bacteroidales bacterium]
MLRLNCFFKANEGKYDEALQAAIALTACSRKDEGNIAYDTFESATNPDVFMICETWTDAEALAKHSAADHFKKYVGQLEALGQLKLEQFDFPEKK